MSSYFHSASPSCPILSANFRYNLRQVRLFRGDSSDIWGMDKSSSATCLLYGHVVKGEKISKRTKKKPWRKRQSRSLRFSFHKYFTTFFYLFLFWITLLYHIFFLDFFFTREIYPHPHRDPHLTHTHDPRHLATLGGGEDPYCFWQPACLPYVSCMARPRSQASADPSLVVSGVSSTTCFREGRLSQSPFPVSDG